MVVVLEKAGDHGGETIAGQKISGGVRELRAPTEVVFEDDFEFRAGRDENDLLVEFGGGAEPFGVPGGDLAEKGATHFLAEHLDHEVEMSSEDADALLKGRFREQFTGIEQVTGPAEQPWIVKCAAPGTDTGTAGDLDHVKRGFGCGDVAIADDGNATDGLNDLPDAFETDGA